MVAAAATPAGEATTWHTGSVTTGGGANVRFNVRGLEVGATGFADRVVVGEVYDLDRPADLAGTYERALVDLGAVVGPDDAVLGNEHGVLLVLRSANGEARVGPAAEGMVVELAE